MIYVIKINSFKYFFAAWSTTVFSWLWYSMWKVLAKGATYISPNNKKIYLEHVSKN